MREIRSMWEMEMWDRERRGGPVHFYRVGERTPIHRPHYTDPNFSSGKTHTLYGAEVEGLEYAYSDRIWQWDHEKAQQATDAANTTDAPTGSPMWYEHYLSSYLGKPVKLCHIIGGVNVSSGYEYFCFGWRDAG